jgi:hypothetical protein
VNSAEVTIANELLANKFSFGYPDREYDEMNGRDEFNITLNFEVRTEVTGEEKNYVSVFRADSYGIQFTKLNLENKDTTDSDSDNDPFFVHVRDMRPSGGITVNKDIQITDGSINPKGVFNAFLSPKRCLLRQGSYLAGMLSLISQSKSIEFISSDRQDSHLTSTDGVTTVVEKANVPVASLDSPLFLPYYVTFESAVPEGIAGVSGAFDNGDYGYISFSVNGYKLKGFPVSAAETMSERSAQQWKVILHPDTPKNFITEIWKEKFV